MAFQRRRHHHYQRCGRMIPLISAVAAALLFLFALLSFLAPTPIDTDHMHHHRQQYTSVLSLSLSRLLSLSLSPITLSDNWFQLLYSSMFKRMMMRLEILWMTRLEILCFAFRLGLSLISIWIRLWFRVSVLGSWFGVCVFLLWFTDEQSDGGKLGRDVWSSRNSEHFHGCSNASSKFPSAYLVGSVIKW